MVMPYIINGVDGAISVMIDGSMKNIDTAHINYDEIKKALGDKDFERVKELVDIESKISETFSVETKADIKIQNGEVLYKGEPIHNTLTDRIIDMVDEKFPVDNMVLFLDNLMLNPSYRAVKELYSFLEYGRIPITERGSFLVYKNITGEWKDIYTGKIDNSPGKTVEMARNQVDEDSSRTCSAGLHVCSYEYLPNFAFGSDTITVVCEVFPQDVVAIPKDYNNTKMRVCRYKVLKQVPMNKDSLSQSSCASGCEMEDEGRLQAMDVHEVNNELKSILKELESFEPDGIEDSDLAINILKDINEDADLDTRLIKGQCKKIFKLFKNDKEQAIRVIGLIRDHIDSLNKIDDEDDELCPYCGEPVDDDGYCEECEEYVD